MCSEHSDLTNLISRSLIRPAENTPVCYSSDGLPHICAPNYNLITAKVPDDTLIDSIPWRYLLVNHLMCSTHCCAASITHVLPLLINYT